MTIDFNPVAFTAKPTLIDRPPEIFAVDDLRALLEASQRTELSVLPMLAIGAFAGLRDAEIKRLEWDEVDLARGHIEVKAAKAKSARRRPIPYTAESCGVVAPLQRFGGPGSARRRARKAESRAESRRSCALAEERFAAFVCLLPTGGDSRRDARGRPSWDIALHRCSTAPVAS